MVSLSTVAGVPFFKQNKTEQCKQSVLSAASFQPWGSPEGLKWPVLWVRLGIVEWEGR